MKQPNGKTDVFETFTPASAWLLGVIWSDGCLMVRKNGHRRVCVSTTDEEVARSAAEQLGTRIYATPAKGRSKPAFKVETGAYVVVERLEALGLTERKSLTCAYPDGLPEEFDAHFIRGYFDGNGCVRLAKRTITGVPRLSVQIVGAGQVLGAIHGKLESAFGRKVSKPHPKETVFQISLNHADAIRFANYAYQGGGVWLARKRNLFEASATHPFRGPALEHWPLSQNGRTQNAS